MRDIVTRKWVVTTMLTAFFVLLLDELAFYWWRQLNPGRIFAGIENPSPTTAWQGPGTEFPNGFRPSGGH